MSIVYLHNNTKYRKGRWTIDRYSPVTCAAMGHPVCGLYFAMVLHRVFVITSGRASVLSQLSVDMHGHAWVPNQVLTLVPILFTRQVHFVCQFMLGHRLVIML